MKTLKLMCSCCFKVLRIKALNKYHLCYHRRVDSLSLVHCLPPYQLLLMLFVLLHTCSTECNNYNVATCAECHIIYYCAILYIYPVPYIFCTLYCCPLRLHSHFSQTTLCFIFTLHLHSNLNVFRSQILSPPFCVVLLSWFSLKND